MSDCMFKNFDEALTEFMFIRQDTAIESQLSPQEQEELRALDIKRKDAIRKIEDAGLNDLTIELDDIDGQVATLEFNAMYRQGFYDGLALMGGVGK